ncbi:hypothetical protein [Acaryochloris sp. IP29b_bin.137]|uniref:hypothetical protein n=1 Tax=Acaryochloris sp. IP29b_bin.137 TaxID=2969217 RepID=UPI00263617B4|nr:hypothetical protein [Acaryochloris sp. IP29b_bin.137]
MSKVAVPLNPYEVLGVTPDTPIRDIPKAFAEAIRQRQHSPQTLAKARKCLMNPDERLLADFSQPLLATQIAPPQLEDFSHFHFADTPLAWNPEWNELGELVKQISAHQPSAADLRVGASVPNVQT